MAEKVATGQPDSAKHGSGLDRRNYEAVRSAVLATLRARGEMTPEALGAEVERRLRSRFAGSVSLYFVSVRRDLEERKLIERVPRSRPPRLRLVGGKSASADSGRRKPQKTQRRVSSRRTTQRRVSSRRR